MTGQVLVNTTAFNPGPYNQTYSISPFVWDDPSSTPSLPLPSSGQPATSSLTPTVMPPYCSSHNNPCNTDRYGQLMHNGTTAYGAHSLRNTTPTVPPPTRPSFALLSQLSSNGSYADQFTSRGEAYRASRGSSGPAQPTSYVPENHVVPAELRQNPRRTSNSNFARGGPPALPRQDERKEEFVEKLVDSAALIIEAIWPLSAAVCRDVHGAQTTNLPLRRFIQETLRRSRTSYSTLQVGLYYLILLKPHVPSVDLTMEQTEESSAKRPLQCGRRMFLAALILSSKWLQDRNYSSKAWSKISGLKISEINENEMAFLSAVGWNLHLSQERYNMWNNLITEITPSLPPPPSPGSAMAAHWQRTHQCNEFQQLILSLDPTLSCIETLPVRKRMPRPAVQHSRSMLAIPSSKEPAGLPGLTALGLLTTSRDSMPQPRRGHSTPAASAASRLLRPSLAEQCAGRYPTPADTPRRAQEWQQPGEPRILQRRSSLAESVMLASSPESMVSDHSDRSMESQTSFTTSMTSVYGDSQPPTLAQAPPSQVKSMPVWDERYYGSESESSPADGVVKVGSTEDVYLPMEREAAYALQDMHKCREPESRRMPKGTKRKAQDESEDPTQHQVRRLLAYDVHQGLAGITSAPGGGGLPRTFRGEQTNALNRCVEHVLDSPSPFGALKRARSDLTFSGTTPYSFEPPSFNPVCVS
jgi:hypothetical protein